jgi:CheY-like chemotaxis protein
MEGGAWDVKTASHATTSHNATRPIRSSPRPGLSWPGLVVAASSMSSKSSATPEAPTIVGVIDSDPVARAGIEALLRPIGVEVVPYDSAEAYLLAGPGKPLACLIVDLLLPGMSGLELLRRLRGLGNDVPLILLADESDVPTAVAAMREGATDFIEKPYVSVAVLKQVQKLLQLGQGAAPGGDAPA